MELEAVWAATHVAGALTALVAGGAVLLWPKGVPTHRTLGKIYALALALVNVAALSLHREAAFGVFHGLAIASLGTLVVGLAPLLLGSRSDRALTTHAYCLTWSYAGLVAAGSGQLGAAVGDDTAPGMVPGVIAAVLCISGVVILARVPSALNRLLPRQSR